MRSKTGLNFEIASLKKKEKRERNIYTRDKKLFYHLDPCITRFHPVYNQCVLDRKITKKKKGKKWKKMKILTCTRKLSSLTPNLI